MHGLKFVKHHHTTGGAVKLYFQKRSWLDRLFGRPGKRVVYQGDCHQWHEVSKWKRVEGGLCAYLTTVQRKLEHGLKP